MSTGNGEATSTDGGDSAGGATASVRAGSDKHRESIKCRYDGRPGYSAACGAFSREHHQHAAELGLCCVDAAFRLDDLDAPPGGWL